MFCCFFIDVYKIIKVELRGIWLREDGGWVFNPGGYVQVEKVPLLVGLFYGYNIYICLGGNSNLISGTPSISPVQLIFFEWK
eukprot:snap_masked-scaffold_16-processed-gene-1.59-mRNA-1 protein AED:1.00 eAED:1.00 QI:0/0/0/0/1/1/5/0/81